MQKIRPLPRHIIVLRLSAMGDVAMLPYAVGALKNSYPDVQITVATRSVFKPFFRDLDVDFLPVDVKLEYRGIRGLFLLCKVLKQTGADAFADEHDVIRSKFMRIILGLSGMRVAKIDKGRKEKHQLLKSHDSHSRWLKHTVTRYCDTLRSFGFEFPDPQPAVKAMRPNPITGIRNNATKIGFAPFSAHQGKTCPDSVRCRITELLSKNFDYVFIHSGSGQEAAFANEMERRYPNVTAVYGKIDGLGEEMDLISNLDCMISMDSLTMHLSSLTATPVVSIWGSTHPSLGFSGYGCDPDDIVQKEMGCRPCSVYGNKECRFGTYDCLASISPEEVIERVKLVSANSKRTKESI